MLELVVNFIPQNFKLTKFDNNSLYSEKIKIKYFQSKNNLESEHTNL